LIFRLDSEYRLLPLFAWKIRHLQRRIYNRLYFPKQQRDVQPKTKRKGEAMKSTEVTNFIFQNTANKGRFISNFILRLQ
jgi:hypothetical protein